MGVSENGGTQQPWVFLLNMIILGCFVVPPFKETPLSNTFRHIKFAQIGNKSLVIVTPTVQFPAAGENSLEV